MRLFAGDQFPRLAVQSGDLQRPWVMPAWMSREHRDRLAALLAQALRALEPGLTLVQLRWAERHLLLSGRLMLPGSVLVWWRVDAIPVVDAEVVVVEGSRLTPGLALYDFERGVSLPAEAWLGPLKMRVLHRIQDRLLDERPVAAHEDLADAVRALSANLVSPIDLVDAAEAMLEVEARGEGLEAAKAEAVARVLAGRFVMGPSDAGVRALVSVGRGEEMTEEGRGALRRMGLADEGGAITLLDLLRDEKTLKRAVLRVAQQGRLEGSLAELASRLFAVHQLRAPPADFTGRADDLDELLAEIEAGATIIGLWGQGGLGKTALALKLAEALAPRFPDAQIDIDLKGVSDAPLAPAAVTAEVIRALQPDAKVPADEGELARMYRSALHGKRCLLLLDNARDKAQIEPLLPPAGSVVIITSRMHFALPGLVAKGLDALPTDDAVSLLRTMAPRLDEDKATRIAMLCGSLPLALTLASGALAERIDLEPEQYVRRLESAQARLELVEASLSLSYELLAPALRDLWRRLSVFPGSFDREAALAVGMPEMADGAAGLSELVKHSMVRYDAAAKRYRLHDLARLYAVARLDEAERYAAEQRHAEHFKRVAATADELYLKGGGSVDAGLGLFDREWENIEAGQAWAATHAAADDDAARLCSDYPDAAAYAIDLRLPPRERIRWLEAALAAAQRLGLREAEGMHLGGMGNAYRELGEPRRGIELYEQRIAIAREIADRRGESNALGNMGNAYKDMGEPQRAIELHEQQRAIAREIGDWVGEATASWNLGLSYEALGDLHKAVEATQLYVDFARAIGHPDAETRAQRLDQLRAMLKP